MNLRVPALLALASLGLAATTACEYTAPQNDQYEPMNAISGTIVADGIPAESLGLTFVFVFDAKNPPPPIGTGAPVTFTAIPASAWTGDDAGVQSAHYTIPYLPDTTEKSGFEAGLLVTALIDADGNFNPFADALGGSTCGDSLGEHRAELASPYPAPVFVEGGEIREDVTIHVNRTQPYQRPAFTTVNPALSISKSKARASLLDLVSNTQVYRIKAVGVHTEYPGECAKSDKTCDSVALDLEGPCAFDPTTSAEACAQAAACVCPDDTQPAPCQTGFPVHFVDNWDYTDPDNPVPGKDGLHDPYPSELQAANGLKDTYPRLFLEYMGTPATDEDGNTIFENELGQFEWPPGTGRMINERWVAENYPLAFSLNLLPANTGAWGPPGAPWDAPFLARELNMTFSPAFRHYHENGTYDADPANGPYDLFDLRCYADPAFGDGNFPSGDPVEQHPATCVDGQPVELSDVPSGAWKMSMVTETGQSWRLPNEIGLPAKAFGVGIEEPLVSTDPAFDVASQGVYMMLVD